MALGQNLRYQFYSCLGVKHPPIYCAFKRPEQSTPRSAPSQMGSQLCRWPSVWETWAWPTRPLRSPSRWIPTMPRATTTLGSWSCGRSGFGDFWKSFFGVHWCGGIRWGDCLASDFDGLFDCSWIDGWYENKYGTDVHYTMERMCMTPT